MAKREWVRITHPNIKAKATVARSALPQMEEQGWREDKPKATEKPEQSGAAGPTDKKEK